MGSPEPEFGSPIPLSDIEDVLAWVDTFKLSRSTKKINRDFADAVLLAEILAVFYPKLVEMHNYPPRNSQAQKLNNWMTLNRKVLKKLKLNLCLKTMEQLSNSIPGSIERVLIMVRDKIKRDEANRLENKDQDQNMSSGGSYYEACSEEDNVLVVPVKQRSGGTLEMVQKKVVSHEVYLGLRDQLRDAREANETLKQKADHFENMIKVKIERIEELQKQLSRKTTRQKENEDLKNTLSVPFSLSEPPSPKVDTKYSLSERNSTEREFEITVHENKNTCFTQKEDKSKLNIEQDTVYTNGKNETNEIALNLIENAQNKEGFEGKGSQLEIKERKSDSKVDLKSKIPVLERFEGKEGKAEKQGLNERTADIDLKNILNSKGDEDEMSYYN